MIAEAGTTSFLWRMSKPRDILGAITGAILIASSGAHSLMGWPVMRQKLSEASAPADLTMGLGIGWNFAGGAILTFGLIVLAVFAQRLRGRASPLVAPRLISVFYTLSGVWSYAISKDTFFMIFIVPGILMAIAAFQPENGDAH
jgi:hypothetical protein